MNKRAMEAIQRQQQQQQSPQEEQEQPHLPPIPVDRYWIKKLLDKYPNPNCRLQNEKALVVAPMVDQSDLPFRLLCRKYGANLCFTPMIHSRILLESAAYQTKFLSTNFDRPIIAQLCGSDPTTVLKAAKMLEPYVDGIDINCGCPQGIARRGDYGAFLLEQETKLLTLVKHLVKHLNVPLSVKVRLLPPPAKPKTAEEENYDIAEESMKLYRKLVDAGIHLLTIHGRTRNQKGHDTGHANWDIIREAVKEFGTKIPIFANGSIETFHDVENCLQVTNADGIMSSESLLEYPPIFYKDQHPSSSDSSTVKRHIGRLQLAEEYMELAKKYPPNVGGQGSGVKCIRVHIHRFLHADLQADTLLRDQLCDTKTLESLEIALAKCKQWHIDHNHDVSTEQLSWYTRHRYENNENKNFTNQEGGSNNDDESEDEGAECGACLFGDEEKGDY